MNDNAINYKLYRDYPDIYFFPGRFFEEEQFTYHDEVHEINALIEEEVLSRPLIFLPPCTNGLLLRHERSFFRRRKQLTTNLVSFCLTSSLNDEAINYKLYRDYPDIYFFPGRFLEEVEFTFNDEVHEMNAIIEDVIDLRRELKNIFHDWYEILTC